MMRKLLVLRLALGLAFSAVNVAAQGANAPTDLAGPAVSELALRAVGPAVKEPDRETALKALRDGVPWSEVVESMGLEDLGRSVDAVYQRLHHLRVPFPRILPGGEFTVDAAGQRVDCRLLRMEFGRGPGGFRLDLAGRYRVGEGSPRLELAVRRRGGNASLRLETVPGRQEPGAYASWELGKAAFRLGTSGVPGSSGGREWTAGVGFPVGKREQVEYSYSQYRHQAVWTHGF